MRILLATILIASSCFAQDPPKGLDAAKNRLYQDLVTEFTVIPAQSKSLPLPPTTAPAITIASKTTRCSVPLLSMTPRNDVQFTTPQIHPPADKYTMIQAVPPAPSCDSDHR
jgi:hypothetical protein